MNYNNDHSKAETEETVAALEEAGVQVAAFQADLTRGHTVKLARFRRTDPMLHQWRMAGRRSTIFRDKNENPFTGETLADIRGASVEDVDDAFAAAKAAQGDWAALPPRARGKYLEEAAHEIDARHDDIVAALAVEAGATNYWA